MHLALKWYAESFSNGKDYRVAYGAMGCCWQLDQVAEANFWIDAVKTTPSKTDDISAEIILDIQASLHELREDCGWCGDKLDTKTRRLCKGCKVYCYCSVKYQKQHWVALDDGHREECKRVVELWEWSKMAFSAQEGLNEKPSMCALKVEIHGRSF